MATKHLLPPVPRYFKANLHTHTTISDGKLSPEEMKQQYKDRGYQILCLTDHNIIVDHSDMNEEDFLMLTGAEYNINEHDWDTQRHWSKTYHLNFIAKRPDNLWQPFMPANLRPGALPYTHLVENENMPKVYDPEAINAMIAEGNRRGFLVMYNHPCWSLQNYTDYAPLKGLWGMEIVNGECCRLGFHDRDNSRVYTDLVNLGNRLYPLGADDAHNAPSVGQAWIMVGAEKLEYSTVIGALEKGDFYASTGPEIYEVSIDGDFLHIECSDAQYITVESGTRFAKRVNPIAPARLIRSGTIDLAQFFEKCSGESPLEWLRVVVHGPYGDYAATRAYFLDELK